MDLDVNDVGRRVRGPAAAAAHASGDSENGGHGGPPQEASQRLSSRRRAMTAAATAAPARAPTPASASPRSTGADSAAARLGAMSWSGGGPRATSGAAVVVGATVNGGGATVVVGRTVVGGAGLAGRRSPAATSEGRPLPLASTARS